MVFVDPWWRYFLGLLIFMSHEKKIIDWTLYLPNAFITIYSDLLP